MGRGAPGGESELDPDAEDDPHNHNGDDPRQPESQPTGFFRSTHERLSFVGSQSLWENSAVPGLVRSSYRTRMYLRSMRGPTSAP